MEYGKVLLGNATVRQWVTYITSLLDGDSDDRLENCEQDRSVVQLEPAVYLEAQGGIMTDEKFLALWRILSNSGGRTMNDLLAKFGQ